MSDDHALGVDLAVALHRTNAVLVRALGEAIADATSAETLVLAVLNQRGATPVSELRHDLGLQPSTLTSILDRLTARRRIVRQVRPDDRRSFLVLLTEVGRAEASQVAARLDELTAAVGPRAGRDTVSALREIAGQLTDG